MSRRHTAITLVGIIAGLVFWFVLYAAINIFGWLLVWGDNGPPKRLNTLPVHATGFGSLGLIGGALGWFVSRLTRQPCVLQQAWDLISRRLECGA